MIYKEMYAPDITRHGRYSTATAFPVITFICEDCGTEASVKAPSIRKAMEIMRKVGWAESCHGRTSRCPNCRRH